MTLQVRRPDAPAGDVSIDLSAIVRPGDHVACGQGSAEPLALTGALMAQRGTIGRFGLFTGGTYASLFTTDHADLVNFSSYAAIGHATGLAKAGLLNVIPCHYSQLPMMFADGRIPVDVALVQLSPSDAKGRHSLGMARDYIMEMTRAARTIVAEVNAAIPWTEDNLWPDDLAIDHVVHTDRPPPAPRYKTGDPINERIAGVIAGLVPDGATIETGIGNIPDCTLQALRHHRDLGIHSGTIGEAAIDLIEGGVVTNACKPIDTGRTVVALLSGGRRLAAFVHRNPAIAVRATAYTHAPATLAALDGLVAINAALEVDLSGQVNAEVIGDRYVGGIGGLADFARGAALAKRGRSIIALASTAQGGTVSRIVPRLGGPVSLSRADADTVVTEWGAAELKGCGFAERARRLIAIAHPQFREGLERDAFHAGSAHR